MVRNLEGNKVISEDIKNKTNEAVKNELQRIIKQYGENYNSIHEAFAVLLEEIDETLEPVKILDNIVRLELWNCVKQNNNQNIKEKLKQIKNYANFSVYELVQVLAVCERFLITMENKNEM